MTARGGAERGRAGLHVNARLVSSRIILLLMGADEGVREVTSSSAPPRKSVHSSKNTSPPRGLLPAGHHHVEGFIQALTPPHTETHPQTQQLIGTAKYDNTN